jgi:hypothetical protein
MRGEKWNRGQKPTYPEHKQKTAAETAESQSIVRPLEGVKGKPCRVDARIDLRLL